MPQLPPAAARVADIVEPKPNLPVFAGALRRELEHHALLRTEGFFYDVITMKPVVAEWSKRAAQAGKPPRRHSAFVLAKDRPDRQRR